MQITAYLKPVCGWSAGIREVLSRYALPYEEKLISDPDNYAEMVAKTQQPLSPCVEIDGKMLADVSGEEVEAYLLVNSLVGTSEKEADAPTNSACENEAETAYIKFEEEKDKS